MCSAVERRRKKASRRSMRGGASVIALPRVYQDRVGVIGALVLPCPPCRLPRQR